MFQKTSLILLFFIVFNKANSQTATLSSEVIQEKLSNYSKANPSNILYVHTDKTVYTNNEILWFSAYLINSGSSYSNSHTLLSVSLMREDNREIRLQDKYIMEDGLSFGSLTLPDTIPPGNYQFNAYTNVLDMKGKPLAVFSQPLTVKSVTRPNFNATLSLLDTVTNNGVIRVKVAVEIKELKPKEKVLVEYNISKGTRKTADLNENSSVITIPAEQLNQAEPVLLTSVKYNKEIQYLSLKLPGIKPRGINVRFFPEGGSLSDGLESVVGLETKTNGDLPLSLTGILYKDAQPVDTISTNSYGVGTFKLKPDIKSRYTLKVSSNNYVKQDTLYALPPVLENGIAMRFINAVVNDTLRVSIFSKQIRKVKVLVHNYRESFALFETEAKPAGSKLSILLPALPKGVNTLTVFDNEGKPLAERLFFAHYDQKVTAVVQPDKPVYNKKDSVHVKLKLTDKAGKPVQGLVSVAAVQDNRIESGKQQDIESYMYLYQDLGKLPQNPQGRGLNDKNYLENIFLIKGWRRYTWQGLMSSSPADTIMKVQLPVIKANVLYSNKLLKKPVEVIIIRDSLVDLANTENDGSLLLNREKLSIIEGRKVFLMVNEKDKEGYTYKVDDPFMMINQQFAGQVELTNLGFAQIVQSSAEQQLQGMERTTVLQAVTIKGARGDDLLYGMGHGANACGDYVCSSNILNCQNHVGDFNNTQPVKGKTYRNRVGSQMSNIIYMGCVMNEKTQLFKISGIYTAKEFYGVNADPAILSEPQYLSTLFWRPGVILNEKGENIFSFFTGDITGKFRIVVQGIGLEDMIFGEGSFTVK